MSFMPLHLSTLEYADEMKGGPSSVHSKRKQIASRRGIEKKCPHWKHHPCHGCRQKKKKKKKEVETWSSGSNGRASQACLHASIHPSIPSIHDRGLHSSTAAYLPGHACVLFRNCGHLHQASSEVPGLLCESLELPSLYSGTISLLSIPSPVDSFSRSLASLASSSNFLSRLLIARST